MIRAECRKYLKINLRICSLYFAVEDLLKINHLVNIALSKVFLVNIAITSKVFLVNIAIASKVSKSILQ